MTNTTHKKAILQLHYNDLRIHDSPVLAHAHHQKNKDVTHFLPVYVFDERVMALGSVPQFSKGIKEGEQRPVTKLGLGDRARAYTDAGIVPEPRTREGGFWKTGRHRVKWTVESVFDLKARYRGRGGDMVVACGTMEDVVVQIVKSLKQAKEEDKVTITEVWMQKEVSTEEVTMQRRLRAALEPFGASLKLADSKPMVDPRDLPFDVEKTPDVYTAFRKQVEGLGERMLRAPLPEIKKIKPAPRLPADISEKVYILNDNLATTSAFLPYLVAPLVAKPDLGDPVKATPIPTDQAGWDAYQLPKDDPRSAFPFVGGETTALRRLDDYLGTVSGQGGSKAMGYKDTRNGLLGEGFSTKFSAWLANGTMSGRYAAWRVQNLMEKLYEQGKLDKHVEGNVYWIQFELLWRDYFYLVSEKYSKLRSFDIERKRKARGLAPDVIPAHEAGTASTLFNIGGFEQVLKPKESQKHINAWNAFNLADPNGKARIFFEGRTGIPFLDAPLREIASTGYMSNRSRQNVASFFAVDLYIDWRVAAEWFETYLSDYDVCSNWGNWQYQAGVGNDPRSSRKFNQIKQANDYDIKDEYVRTWVPEIKDVDTKFVQTPWLLPENQKKGLDYPSQPLVEAPEWKKHYRIHGKGGNRGGAGGGDHSGGPGGRGGRGGGHGSRGGHGGHGGGRPRNEGQPGQGRSQGRRQVPGSDPARA